jgi:signal transduction histidine kinase/CheY-like chemotaxis protein
MKRFSSLSIRLVGFVFLVLALALTILVYAHGSWVWPGFSMGMVALTAAWAGGQLFVLTQVKTISKTAENLAKGDLSARTGLLREPTELGDLARSIDKMAEMLEHQHAEQKIARETLIQKANLEEQLRQSQKMESIGQLAAGVAHDFNNILTIIQGHAGLMLTYPNLSPSLGNSIQSISFAAERATSLTRQLLLFSRKQVVQPRPTDLKIVVNDVSKMLQRLIGENIFLDCRHPDNLPLINGDSGMMEQVLMNLAVNARDAMANGGTLTISTHETTISHALTGLHAESYPGHFVCLQVDDTGTGMDEGTVARIFEPFFTTKESGKGTGLGLATVYGIVKQHSGWIEVESTIGKGTRFKIFLPAAPNAQLEKASATIPKKVAGGTERILIVEDEPVLRDLSQLILQDFGYKTSSAGSGVDALATWIKSEGGFDLLLTDMIMPEGLSGKELADALLKKKPDLKVLFTSGYNVEDMSGITGLKRDGVFLQKPYSRVELARAVRASLDALAVS